MGEDRTSSRIKAGRRRQSLPRRCSVTRHYAKLFGVPSFSPSNLYSSESCTEGCHSKQQKSADILSWTMGLVPWNVVVCLSSRLKAVLIHTEIIYVYRAGSGFKLNAQDLSSLTLNLGNHTTTPNVSVGVSLNYGDFVTVNVTAGSNTIPLDSVPRTTSVGHNTVVRIDAFGWQNNRVNLESITLNSVSNFIR